MLFRKLTLKLGEERLGFRVVEGHDGFDAMRLRFGNPIPDAMLLNGLMPGMTGPEAIRAIREREQAEERRHMPIALFTGFATEHEALAQRCGACASFGLPIAIDGVLASVDRLLAGCWTHELPTGHSAALSPGVEAMFRRMRMIV